MSVLTILATCAATALWVKPPPPTAVLPTPDEGSFRRGRRGGKFRFPWASGARPAHRDDAALIGAALTSVAARLRAGQSPHGAWRAGLENLPGTMARDMMALASAGSNRGGPHGHTNATLNAAWAATRLAQDLGAELAPVLEACAEGIEESARAHSERQTAFAGPRATARLLLALPLVGVGLGTLMGASPLSLFVSSIWGGLLACAALTLLVIGRGWIHQLLRKARTVSEDDP